MRKKKIRKYKYERIDWVAVNAFKNELENYLFYKNNLKGTEEMIAINEYMLENVHGMDPSKELSFNNSPKAWVESDKYKEVSKELEFYTKRKETRLKQIEYIELVLDRLNPTIRDYIDRIYLDGVSYYDLAKEINVTKTTLHRKIVRELSKKI